MTYILSGGALNSTQTKPNLRRISSYSRRCGIALLAIAGSSSWCPKIYFNYRCFTGPYLSKGRLMLLPQSVGPGPVSLVMREVLSMLINVAYKSSRVLRELQSDDAVPNPAMQQTVLGAKYVVST